MVHTVPLAAVYVVWSQTYGRTAQTNIAWHPIRKSVRISIEATFNALGQVPFVGWAIATMLLVGLFLAWRNASREERAQRLAAPTALAFGSLVFAIVISVARRGGFFFGNASPASSRYLHILAALLLPAIAVAGDELIRRRRAVAVVVIALLVVGLPGNIEKTDDNIFPASFYTGQRHIIESLPAMRLARQVPRSLHPTPSFAAEVTLGWLLDGVSSGRIPAAKTITPTEVAANTLRLSLEQTDSRPQPSCVRIRTPLIRHLRDGQSFGVTGTLSIQLLTDDGRPKSARLNFGGSLVANSPTHSLRAVKGPLTIRIASASFNAAICES